VKTCYPPRLEDDGYLYQMCETTEHHAVDETLSRSTEWTSGIRRSPRRCAGSPCSSPS
jgi:hypothetical protein